ncbi:MAG TPA: arginine--tRNA ligase [Stellaceae bacterium]|nr:arginine--tRNA ligase [Stellaceae bacterium]
MDLYAHFHGFIVAEIEALVGAGELPAGLDASRIAVEPPRDPAHGDLSTNAAMVLAKPARMAPKAIAERLRPRLARLPDVTAAEIAGPGFLNLRLRDSFWHARLAELLRAGPSYGDSTMGQGRPVNVEYVSANPTGPMHVGHGRGAVVGDALASLLAKVGFAVTREYYINDAGAQVDALARSLHVRYREALGGKIGALPEGFYPGEYMKEIGSIAASMVRNLWSGADWQDREAEWLPTFRDIAIKLIMEMIKQDLAALGIEHAVFTSEREIVNSGAIERAMETLEARGLVYVGTLEPPKGHLPDDWEPVPLTLFRSTPFGDDVDRPLKKSDGSWTYFAADMAYHFDKYQRGFADMIDVWGADHGGYVKRMQAAVTALTGGAGALDVKLCQLVNLLDHGEPVRMSKRAGVFVTLREVVDQVGKDVFRFVMLTRRNDQALDFDFAKVVEQSKDNPVFYVQYAHARARSVLRHATEMFSPEALAPDALAAAPLDRLADRDEIALVRQLATWPRVVEAAAEAHEPHRIAFFLHDLAAAFHGLWTRGMDDANLRFIVSAAPDVTLARLALVQGVAFVVASGLAVFGVAPAEEMR